MAIFIGKHRAKKHIIKRIVLTLFWHVGSTEQNIRIILFFVVHNAKYKFQIVSAVDDANDVKF